MEKREYSCPSASEGTGSRNTTSSQHRYQNLRVLQSLIEKRAGRCIRVQSDCNYTATCMWTKTKEAAGEDRTLHRKAAEHCTTAFVSAPGRWLGDRAHSTTHSTR